jgi:RimJ/RimL family protein N-acetyltransferase
MPLERTSYSGSAYLAAVTELLQRARLEDGDAGMWEAADLQWWWRTPRASDQLEQRFWVDQHGPAATAAFTQWGDVWGCDPVGLPSLADDLLPAVWSSALQTIRDLDLRSVEALVREDDARLLELLTGSGFVATDDTSGISWMDAADRPSVVPPPAVFTVVDRTQQPERPHPMVPRNGAEAEARLRTCSLYDPALDLAVVIADGDVAGYALFWLDPVTGVGLVEPVRVEEQYWRRGLARAMLTDGLDRLAQGGARRLKIGYASDAARALYLSCGFRETATARTYWLSPSG